MREPQLRETDVRFFEGVTSNPDVEYPETPYEIEQTTADDEHDADPIPVIVVDTVNPADFTDWGAEQFTVNGENPVHIAGARNNRTRLVVTNLGADTVFLVRGAVAPSYTGAPIPVNGVVEMTTNRDVYATCLTGDTALIGVIQEFIIDDDK
jgi:hypothetical protein